MKREFEPNSNTEEFSRLENLMRTQCVLAIQNPDTEMALNWQRLRLHASTLVTLLSLYRFSGLRNGFGELDAPVGVIQEHANALVRNSKLLPRLHVSIDQDRTRTVLRYEFGFPGEPNYPLSDVEWNTIQDRCIGSEFSPNPLRIDQHGLNQYLIIPFDGFENPRAVLSALLFPRLPLQKYLHRFIGIIDTIPATKTVPFRRILLKNAPEYIALETLSTWFINPSRAAWAMRNSKENMSSMQELLFAEIGSFVSNNRQYSIWTQAETAQIPLTSTLLSGGPVTAIFPLTP